MNELEITPAEWRVIRIVWSKKAVTSSQVIEFLAPLMDWKDATVKTLLRRLVEKGALTATKQGRAFIYRPAVEEQATIDQAVENLFSGICQMRAGDALIHAMKQVPLSKNDVHALQALLAEKAKAAPEQVPCNCLPGDEMCNCD